MTPSKATQQEQSQLWRLDLGASYLGSHKTHFRVWAPRADFIQVKLLGVQKSKDDRVVAMQRDANGFHACSVKDVSPGMRYCFLVNDQARPDPASRFQPEGVHGPSEVVDPASHGWCDTNWKGVSLSNLVLYELHVGTFTSEGTLEAVIKKIPHLKKLGASAIELMPLAQCPGGRNWGYDGVDLFAVQHTYGGPDALKKLVDACHQNEIAVCLDVVYNHLGPEGNYLNEFGPYFTKKHHTPWGDAVNFDGENATFVREFFIANALFWITEYHIDILRLDAVHGIFDMSKPHVLKELNARVKAQSRVLNREVLLIAESDLNDPILIRSEQEGGYELDAQWSDDFHHATHVALTGERRGYYRDYTYLEDIAKAIKSGFVYDGKYSSFRQKEYGKTAEGISGARFVVSLQNHDQIGNRAHGDRLSTQISFSAQKLSAAILLAAPATPLIFMGQEYGETAPFQYFVDHSDTKLLDAVRAGRKVECASFGWNEVPDPKDVKAFKQSKLSWTLLKKKKHDQLLALYRDLIQLRKSIPELSMLNRKDLRVYVNEDRRWLAVEYPFGVPGAGVGFVASFLKEQHQVQLPFRNCTSYEILLDTENKKYGGASDRKNATCSRDIVLQPEQAVIGKII